MASGAAVAGTGELADVLDRFKAQHADSLNHESFRNLQAATD
jgi:hypothetical protein